MFLKCFQRYLDILSSFKQKFSRQYLAKIKQLRCMIQRFPYKWATRKLLIYTFFYIICQKKKKKKEQKPVYNSRIVESSILLILKTAATI